MADTRPRPRSPFLRALAVDDSLPIEPAAVRLWLDDLERPTRWSLRPLLQFLLAVLLHLIWFVKRLPLPQFRAHGLLQRLICWFCTHFVSPSANQLILRHFATESNILNFLLDHRPEAPVDPPHPYPTPLPALPPPHRAGWRWPSRRVRSSSLPLGLRTGR